MKRPTAWAAGSLVLGITSGLPILEAVADRVRELEPRAYDPRLGWHPAASAVLLGMAGSALGLGIAAALRASGRPWGRAMATVAAGVSLFSVGYWATTLILTVLGG